MNKDLLHEKYAMLIIKTHLNMDEYISAGEEGTTSIERDTTNQLDAIATTLRDRMVSSNIPLTDHVLAIRLLMAIVFDEFGFSVNDHGSITLNHVVRDKSGVSRAIALLIKLVCRRVGYQVDLITERGEIHLGVTPENRADPYEIVFNLKAEQLSPQECQELTPQEGRAKSYSPISISNLFLAMLPHQLKVAPDHTLITRNNNLWGKVFSFDPIEITYEACPRFAGRLDDGTL
jgi:hypothetical protein